MSENQNPLNHLLLGMLQHHLTRCAAAVRAPLRMSDAKVTIVVRAPEALPHEAVISTDDDLSVVRDSLMHFAKEQNPQMRAMQFNINHYVRVKLTDLGRASLRYQHEDLYRSFKPPVPYTPIEEDADGWSTWQLWDLMGRLGRHFYGGCLFPFEPEFEILADGASS
jgi:hypothetical protein